MNDSMKLGDNLALHLECGHPNKKEGELCELCGKTVQNSSAENPKELAGQELTESAQQEKQ